MDQARLTEEQDHLIDQFYLITASQSIPRDTVIRTLETADWNLEIAIIAYYQAHPQTQRNFISTYSESVQASNNHSFMSFFGGSSGNRGDDPLLPGSFPTSAETVSSSKLAVAVMMGFQVLIVLPLYAILKVLTLLAGLVVEKVVPIINVVIGLKANSNTYYAKKNYTNPIKRSRRFIYEFDEGINNKPLIDTPLSATPDIGIRASDSSLMEISRPDFLECSYTNALYVVKKQYRWLLVYLQSDEHEDKQAFINQVLLNEQFLGFLKNNEILTWGGNVKESEGFQVANNFNVSRFPFLGLMTLVTEEQSSSVQISLVARVDGLSMNYLRANGSINTRKIIRKLQKTYERLNPAVVSMRTEASERDRTRDLRMAQDVAYQRSLAVDRAREEQRQREREQALEQERAARTAEAMKEKKLKWLRYKYSGLEQKISALEMSDKKQVSRIAIRLPNGHRFQYTFHRTCSIEDIFLVADCALNDVLDEATTGDVLQAPENYDHRYTFKLLNIMPRAELQFDATQAIGDNNLVFPNGNLVVEENE